MARITVFTDRLPDDRDWKGPCVWEIIRGLADSHHEVSVFTTCEPERIPLTHPRLTIASPAVTWGADKLARWTRALVTSRPEVIHTFALSRSSSWSAASVWPYLNAIGHALPGVLRISTMFEREDFTASPAGLPWYQGSDSWTLFSPEDEWAARQIFDGRIDLVPFDHSISDAEDAVRQGESDKLAPGEDLTGNGRRHGLLVPSPVSAWPDRRMGLTLLCDFLIRNAETTVSINGGWGDLSLSERRQGWQILMPVAARVRFIEPQSLPRFERLLQEAGQVWTQGLRGESWRVRLAIHLARAFAKDCVGPAAVRLREGSTANFLSRMYADGLFSTRPVC